VTPPAHLETRENPSHRKDMSRPKGFGAVTWLRERELSKRGGNDRKSPLALDRSAPDALAVWRDSYLDSLAARNYTAATVSGRLKDINLFLA
jgi:hypothetical protein